MKIHIVQKGETIWDIAEKHGVDFTEVVELNPQISSPDMIMPGMKIKIPVSAKQVKEQKITKEKPKTQPKKETVKESENKKEEKQSQVPSPTKSKEEKIEHTEMDLLEKSMPPSFALPEMPVLPQGKEFMGEEVKMKETVEKEKGVPFAAEKKEQKEKKMEMDSQMKTSPQQSMPLPYGVPFPGAMENQMQVPQGPWHPMPMMPCCCCQMRSQIYAPQMMYAPPAQPWETASYSRGGVQPMGEPEMSQEYMRAVDQVPYPQAQQPYGWSPHMRTMQKEDALRESEEEKGRQFSPKTETAGNFSEQQSSIHVPPIYPQYTDDQENES